MQNVILSIVVLALGWGWGWGGVGVFTHIHPHHTCLLCWCTSVQAISLRQGLRGRGARPRFDFSHEFDVKRWWRCFARTLGEGWVVRIDS